MLIWTCRTCGRDFPAPRSGRDRCLSCVVRERKRVRAAVMVSAPRRRRDAATERRVGHDRRVYADRRMGVDRRVVDIRVARERRLLDRRLTTDRRAAERRRLGATSAM